MNRLENNHKLTRGSLEYWAEKKTNEPAIIDEDGSILNWGSWNEKSDKIAEALIKAGIGAEDIVAVRTNIRPEWFIINRALSKIGCSQLLVNNRLSGQEVRYLMENSKAKAIFYDDEDPEALMELWDEFGLSFRVSIGSTKELGNIKNFEELLMGDPAPSRYSNGYNTEMIVYTSGTTGRPKGVYLEPYLRELRKNELNEYRKDSAQYTTSSPGGKSLLSLPLHHSLGPIMARDTHLVGNPVILQRRFNPEKTLELIEKYQITYWLCVPTMLNRIANLPENVLDNYDVSSIKQLRCSAAPIKTGLKEWVIDYFGDHCLYEGYGVTETGTLTIMTPEMHTRKPGSCGRPYKNVFISIRNDNGEELPVRENGEIWIKSPQTIDRYINSEPLGEDTLDKAGYFKVGDVGYLDEDGYLYITGRKKDMIISGGVNIYPREIEDALQKHPHVSIAAVIGIPNEDFGEEVKAFCEVKENQTITENELMEFCKNELASYKCPRTIEFVNALPRNAMGKIMKHKLRENYWKEAGRNI
ncbi:class I adenylate-forming enzyme family protein [Oceanobacillus longus]|uniref:Class I adenylate-forming enzyme family protein n=1 Tax=Oceanobacillus longus TaxID=930120 RepID=A0ABV8H2W0_9BACI